MLGPVSLGGDVNNALVPGLGEGLQGVRGAAAEDAGAAEVAGASVAEEVRDRRTLFLARSATSALGSLTDDFRAVGVERLLSASGPLEATVARRARPRRPGCGGLEFGKGGSGDDDGIEV